MEIKVNYENDSKKIKIYSSFNEFKKEIFQKFKISKKNISNIILIGYLENAKINVEIDNETYKKYFIENYDNENIIQLISIENKLKYEINQIIQPIIKSFDSKFKDLEKKLEEVKKELNYYKKERKKKEIDSNKNLSYNNEINAQNLNLFTHFENENDNQNMKDNSNNNNEIKNEKKKSILSSFYNEYIKDNSNNNNEIKNEEKNIKNSSISKDFNSKDLQNNINQNEFEKKKEKNKNEEEIIKNDTIFEGFYINFLNDN